MIANDNDLTVASCCCPTRQILPPVPSNLPFPVFEANCEKLQEDLLNNYKSSIFNTCENQRLSLTVCSPPMKLMIDPNAKSVAHHTPIPVPLHWREAVKEGLDQDVRFCVLEQVPIGDPVTWCHRMFVHVCALKNSKP